MPILSSSRAERLAALRAEVRAIESAAVKGKECLPFGVAAVDRRLEGGGLATAALTGRNIGDAAIACMRGSGRVPAFPMTPPLPCSSPASPLGCLAPSFGPWPAATFSLPA